MRQTRLQYDGLVVILVIDEFEHAVRHRLPALYMTFRGLISLRVQFKVHILISITKYIDVTSLIHPARECLRGEPSMCPTLNDLMCTRGVCLPN
jgi:hypothetical protein